MSCHGNAENSGWTIDYVLDKVCFYLLGPFQSWDNFLSAISGPLNAVIDIHNKTAWPYLLSGVVIAWLIFVVKKKRGDVTHGTKFRHFLFPSEIYFHPSAKTDYKFAFIDLCIRLVIYIPFISGLSGLFYKVAVSMLGVSSASLDRIPASAVTFVAAICIMDFAFFLSHFLMHKIPLLWQFHQVHHSAEVLTPVTVYRVHPIETLVTSIVSAVVGALTAVCYTSLSDHHLNFVSLFGLNIVTFAFFLGGNVLRHSHVWVSFGPWLSWIFISPAQHQIHHSFETRHWNKNFGYIFAVWDVCIGSLYVPRKLERIQFGIPDSDPAEFSTVSRLYFRPFLKAVEPWLRLQRVKPDARLVNPVKRNRIPVEQSLRPLLEQPIKAPQGSFRQIEAVLTTGPAHSAERFNSIKETVNT
jgi:sterol desaturase/sphingolipid hydroxylase (fatty acid hydroxylase superfamily)